jgi:hypothetical protein
MILNKQRSAERIMKHSFISLLLVSLSTTVAESFMVDLTYRRLVHASGTPTARYSFFKDMFDAAFENDASLSRDNKRAGMLDEGTEEAERLAQVTQLTSTQQAWRQKMMPTTISPADLEGSAITLDLFLTGVPNKDSANDLFGSKTRISLRDRAVGQVVPDAPTLSGVQVLFQANQRCVVTVAETSYGGFCKTDQPGDWKLSDGDGGRKIRFRIAVTGYTRTIQTKGTIQKIYWSSDQAEQTTRTSTIYSIPEGWLYFEAELASSKAPGKSIQWVDGILKVEQSKGLLGAASVMIPCGKFSVKPATLPLTDISISQREQERNP